MLVARRVLIVLELLIGILAVAGGLALIVRPAGDVLGFDVMMLNGTFRSFQVPGVLLFLMGLLHLLAAFVTHKRLLWDHVISTVAGTVLILWVSVQVILIGFQSWTQLAFFLAGNATFYLATELWREGEGPHLGMAEGFEELDIKKTREVAPAWRRSDRFRLLQLILRRGRRA